MEPDSQPTPNIDDDKHISSQDTNLEDTETPQPTKRKLSDGGDISELRRTRCKTESTLDNQNDVLYFFIIQKKKRKNKIQKI